MQTPRSWSNINFEKNPTTKVPKQRIINRLLIDFNSELCVHHLPYLEVGLI